MKIYLVGMPGSGKSTLARKVAAQLLIKFVDLDEEIERYENKKIAEIFLEKGEDHFRQIESKLLHEWASSSEDFVMATGGGAPCYHGGMETINKTGLSIFLDVPMPELIKRVQSKTHRPLLSPAGPEKKLMSLLETRLPCYRQAAVTIRKPDLNKLLEAIHFKR